MMGEEVKEEEEKPIAIPEALKYILWRYGQDHRGEDHQKRIQEVKEWAMTLGGKFDES